MNEKAFKNYSIRRESKALTFHRPNPGPASERPSVERDCSVSATDKVAWTDVRGRRRAVSLCVIDFEKEVTSKEVTLALPILKGRKRMVTAPVLANRFNNRRLLINDY